MPAAWRKAGTSAQVIARGEAGSRLIWPKPSQIVAKSSSRHHVFKPTLVIGLKTLQGEFELVRVNPCTIQSGAPNPYERSGQY